MAKNCVKWACHIVRTVFSKTLSKYMNFKCSIEWEAEEYNLKYSPEMPSNIEGSLKQF